MPRPSISGIFCEDIREEKNGMFTIVGIFQDNVNIKADAGVLPKLGMYVRTSFENKAPIPPGTITLHFSDGETFEVANITQEMIDNVVTTTTKQDNPVCTFVSRALLHGVRISAGRQSIIAKFGEETFPVSTLNIVNKKDKDDKDAISSSET